MYITEKRENFPSYAVHTSLVKTGSVLEVDNSLFIMNFVRPNFNIECKRKAITTKYLRSVMNSSHGH